jgi:YesN/AraC family two-component response regulator
MEQCVLFVDDEQSVLSSIRRMLLDEPYEQLFASGGEEALKRLEDNQVSVIISDMRMPIMDGVAFLEKSRELRPHAIRIILSGQSDMYAVKQAINRGGIWQYISKPWNDDDMKLMIKNALDLYEAQVERLRLIDELERKNSELEQLNNELEERVLQRTRLIETQKQLMQRMIDGMDLDDFVKSACTYISELAQGIGVALFYAIGQTSMTSSGTDIDDALRKRIEDAFKNRKEIRSGELLIIPINHSSTTLGCIVFPHIEESEKDCIDDVLNSMIPILSLALSQFKTIQDAPDIAKSLDDIIDQL